MDIQAYNWKTVRTVTKKAYKVVEIKDSTSSQNGEDDSSTRMKVLVKRVARKRKEIELWYDRLIVPEDLISDTIRYNCSLHGGVSTEDLFRIITIDTLTPLYLLQLTTNPTDLEKSLYPKIKKVFTIEKMEGQFVTIKNVEDKYETYEINIKKQAQMKMGVLCLIPNYQF